MATATLSTPSSSILSLEQPQPSWEYIYALELQLHNIECRSMMQCWVLNELGLALDHLYQHLRLTPDTQLPVTHEPILALLEYLRTASPSLEWHEWMRERVERVSEQCRPGIIQEGFLLHCPPCYPPLIPPVHSLWFEAAQTAPELPCSIALHKREPSRPVVRLPSAAGSLDEEDRSSSEHGSKMTSAQRRLHKVYPVIPLSGL